MNRYIYPTFHRPHKSTNKFSVGDIVSLVSEPAKLATIYEVTPKGRYYLGGLDGSPYEDRSQWFAWHELDLNLEKPHNGEWVKP